MFFNLAADNVPALLDDLGLSAAALEGELSQKII